MNVARDPELWIPGPTKVRPEVLAACARPPIGHRSREMKGLLGELVPRLRDLFGTGGPVLLAASSASGLMEAAARNFVRRRLLVFVNGAFAERFAAVARACGKEVVAAEVPLGEGVTPEAARRAIPAEPPDAVAWVANESSTGAFSPIGPVAQALRERFPDALLLVDVVTALAGTEIGFDACRLDFAFAGSQKALALPPGLALAAVSERALARARDVPDRGWYFDAPLLVEALERLETPATPAIPLLFGLRRQFEDVAAAGGWPARYERHRALAAAFDAWASARGLLSFPPPAFRSPTVACVRADGLDVASFRERLRERGYVVADGYGKLRGKTFRVGHMGDHGEEDLRRLLAAADEALTETGWPNAR